MPGKVYLTGASGRLGSAVLSKIDAIPLVRRPSGLKGEVVTDFSIDQLRGILGDARAVIHLAGSLDTLEGKKLHESNVGLTWRIVNAIPDSCKIVFSSSISVYGKKLAKKPADEETKTNPDSDYSRTKLQAEGVVRKHPLHVILRIGTIYGPQFADYFMIFDRIKAGKMRIIGTGENRIPFVHADDVAAVIAAAAEKGQGTYVVAGEPLKQKEIFAIAAKELGAEPPKKKIPLPVASLAAGIFAMLARLAHKKPKMTPEHVAVLGNDRIFDCKKAKNELGFAPRLLEQGIKEMALEYKNRASASGKR
jgi:nucleoside-diphosphate-sugar epimerase